MLEPLNGRVLIKRFEKERVSRGGIALPECSQKRSSRGKVVDFCRSWVDHGIVIQSSLQKNQVVIFPEYQGEEVEDSNGDKFILICEHQLLAREDN